VYDNFVITIATEITKQLYVQTTILFIPSMAYHFATETAKTMLLTILQFIIFAGETAYKELY